MATNKDQLANLMNLTSGDKKHDPSAYSTLGVLTVLYDRILNYRCRPIHGARTAIDSL